MNIQELKSTNSAQIVSVEKKEISESQKVTKTKQVALEQLPKLMKSADSSLLSYALKVLPSKPIFALMGLVSTVAFAYLTLYPNQPKPCSDVTPYLNLSQLPDNLLLIAHGPSDQPKNGTFGLNFHNLRGFNIDGKPLNGPEDFTDPNSDCLISSTPTEKGWETLCNRFYCSNVCVIDSRHELHFFGSFITPEGKTESRPFTIRNKRNDAFNSCDSESVTRLEKEMVNYINKERPIVPYCIKKKDKVNGNWYVCDGEIQLFHAQTEEQLVTKHKAAYIRAPMIDHQPGFLESFYKAAEAFRNFKDRYFFLHCSAGQGRTLQLAHLFYALKKILYGPASVLYENANGKVSFCANKPEKLVGDANVHGQLFHCIYPWAQSAEVQAAMLDPSLPLPPITCDNPPALTQEEYLTLQQEFGRLLTERNSLCERGGGD